MCSVIPDCRVVSSRTWARGDSFSLADGAAAPAFYANEVLPFEGHA
jgi:glutathione S-transferase